MKFVFPNARYEKKAAEFIQEFNDSQSESNGDGGLNYFLQNHHTYQEWLDKINRDIDIANIPEGRVPQFTYFFVREEDDKIVGMIAIRLALNDFLRNEGGHIAYCIRPGERGRGYATQMLKESVIFCNAVGLSDIILSCNKANVASAKVIKNCGGLLSAEFYSNTFHYVIQRYHIKQKI